ncbi:MAG: hypothetical protein A4S09_16160 [Proteobacteria bacterium SG_bin7]|nr:MAG: hypothetical protein A4S09_16160 [Proteobacteria bacterium SG_bin7]
MYRILTPTTIWASLVVFSISIAQNIVTYQTLEAIALDAAVLARNRVESITRHPNISELRGHHAVIIPPSRITYEDIRFYEEFKSQLSKSSYGQILLGAALAGKELELRIFHDVPIENGIVNHTRPMWVNDRLVRHELKGAYHSDEKRGVIALNNFQSKDEAVYIFAHELYHLVDGNKPKGDFDGFIAEYRANLVEAIVYLQRKLEDKIPKFSRDVFIESKEYENLLDRPSWLRSVFSSNTPDPVVDPDKVFKATLDLLYPETPKFRILRVATIEPQALIDEEMNSYEIVIRALVKILGGNEKIFPSLLEFTENPGDLKVLADRNKKMRTRIEDYFSNPQNKEIFKLETIYNLNSERFNNAYQGHGGPRGRGPGG